MAELLDTSGRTVNEHVKNVHEEGELEPETTIRTALASGQLMSVNKHKPPLKSMTVELHVRPMRIVFNHALADDLIPYNAFDRLTVAQPMPFP